MDAVKFLRPLGTCEKSYKHFCFLRFNIESYGKIDIFTYYKLLDIKKLMKILLIENGHMKINYLLKKVSMGTCESQKCVFLKCSFLKCVYIYRLSINIWLVFSSKKLSVLTF